MKITKMEVLFIIQMKRIYGLSDSIQNKRYKDVNKERLVQDIPSRLRVYKINTNGHDFDGNGGPEFRFFRKWIL